jgi:hypothetical protein
MGESATPARLATQGGQRPVTTTDAWKLFALAFVLIDHYGFYFDPDEAWWRLFGRLASPVFFFFIGFARTRTVPWTWIAFGFVITAVDYITSPRDILINILLNFTLVRLFLPTIEAHVMPYPLRLAALAATSAAVIPVLDPVLEYGGEGWLWALFGLSHRLFLEHGDGFSLWRRYALALAAAAAYIVREIHDYGFDTLQSAVLVAMIVAEVLVLLRFRREDLAWQPPSAVRPVFAFAGRRSLEIYALTLLAMQLLAFSIGGAAADDSAEDHEEDSS